MMPFYTYIMLLTTVSDLHAKPNVLCGNLKKNKTVFFKLSCMTVCANEKEELQT